MNKVSDRRKWAYLPKNTIDVIESRGFGGDANGLFLDDEIRA